jgi:hypothetical protein
MALFKINGVYVDGTGATLPTRQDLTFPQGEDVTVQVTVSGQNGTAINLTGYSGTMLWKVAQANSSMPVSLSLPLALTNPTQGIGTFTLSAGVSKTLTASMYFYDVFITSGSGAKDEVVPTSMVTLNFAVGA